MAETTFADLPEDVILSIAPYLKPKEFLALCSINRHFHETYNLEPSFWREATRKTFRLPVNPLLKADGPRWHWLYKRLSTKTKFYTWGQGAAGSRLTQPRGFPMQSGSAWPHEAYPEEDMGVVVDVQCGGWSYTLLNSNGILYSTGRLDGTNLQNQSFQKPTRMDFPGAYPPTSPIRYEPTTAIKQYSSGRRHVLGLSDSGKIWFWNDKKPALQVKFLHIDIVEGDERGRNPHGIIRSVVAGWVESSAYVSGYGIVYWNVFKNDISRSETEETDTVLFDSNTVPGTGYTRPKAQGRYTVQKDHEIGEVLKHVVLSEYIVFITDLNKVFAASMKPLENFDDSDRRPSGIPPNDVFELTTFSKPGHVLKDIQGSFERFAVFGSEGSVLLGHRHLVQSFWSHQRQPLPNLPKPRILPALQSSNVISLAFGDHHFHALHSSGRISSYGTEPQGCGALGLGETNERRFRGVRTVNRDASLVPHAEHCPHYIWFEEDKRNWLYRLHRASNEVEAIPRRNITTNDIQLIGEFSEWVEQEGLAWDDFPEIKDQDPDGLGAYFALTVAAAGWHSCALVLVNDDLADMIKRKHVHGGANISPHGKYLLVRSADEDKYTNGFEDEAIQAFRYDFYDQPFPRLRLPSGFEMPGEGEFNEWHYGLPPVRSNVNPDDRV